MTETTRVLVCDHQSLVCTGLTSILKCASGISVVGTATTLDTAFELVRTHEPHVVVIGDEPTWDAVGLAKAINELRPDQKSAILLLLAREKIPSSLLRALRAGARGLLCKDSAEQRLVTTVQQVAAGALVVGQPAASHVVDELRLTLATPPDNGIEPLSKRELEVVELVARGLTNDEIAARLRLSTSTVKSHVYSVFRKLNLRDRVQIVILAYESGLVRPGEPSRHRPIATADG